MLLENILLSVMMMTMFILKLMNIAINMLKTMILIVFVLILEDSRIIKANRMMTILI